MTPTPPAPPPPPTGERAKITLQDAPTASPALLEALNSHLPFSLPVLRRIQFASKFPGGSTPSTHILYATYDQEEDDDVAITNSPQQKHGSAGSGKEEGGKSRRKPKHFVAAYLDLSRYPETQSWFYSTLEDFFPDPTAPIAAGEGTCTEEDKKKSDALVLAVLQRMYEISQVHPGPNGSTETGGEIGREKRKPQHKHTVLIGSLHETIRQRILKCLGVRMYKTRNIPDELDWELCNKWLFRIGELPDYSGLFLSCLNPDDGDDDSVGGSGLVVEMEMRSSKRPVVEVAGGNGQDAEKATTRIKIRFDKARREDIPLIRSRTSIDRKEETLLRLPSLVLRRIYDPSTFSSPPGTNQEGGDEGKDLEEKEEEPIAWAFTGTDGTLMTLHVEPAYRGMGLAKLIACKIMRDSIIPANYGDDGWGAADVFVQNTQSQGVCAAIGGKKWWTLSWAVLDLSTLPYTLS